MKLTSFKNIFALLLLSFLASCGKPKLPESAYSIPAVIVNAPDYGMLIDAGPLFYGYKEERRVRFESEERAMYSRFKEHHYISTDEIELEFYLPEWISINNRSYSQKRMYLIGGRQADNKYENRDSLKTFYLKWLNRGKSLNPNEEGNYFKLLPWEIGEATDSLETNLALKEIKRLYPKFKGIYIQKFPKKIVIDHNKAYDHFKSQEPVIFEY